jgi:hypothetical protein
VHLEPGGLVRMNFAVTPTFQEGNHKWKVEQKFSAPSWW